MKTHPRIALLSIILMSGVLFHFIGFFEMPVMAAERFILNSNGAVIDTKTSLMWAEKDNGIPINWHNARSYCQNFKAGGHHDWRMPTIKELASLFDPIEKNNSGYHLTKFINTTASSCWALEVRGNTAGRFNFTYGKVYWLRQYYSGPTRVLPVRSIK